MNVALLVMQTGIAKNKSIYVSSFVHLNKWHLNMYLIYFEQVCIFLHIAVLFFPQASFNRETPIPSPDAWFQSEGWSDCSPPGITEALTMQ